MVHALRAAPAADSRRLREILTKEREATTSEDVAEAVEIFGRAGSLPAALREIAARRARALRALAPMEHQHLSAVVEAMCELFLAPIQKVIERAGAAASDPAPAV